MLIVGNNKVLEDTRPQHAMQGGAQVCRGARFSQYLRAYTICIWKPF